MVFIIQKAVLFIADMFGEGMAQLEQLWPMGDFGQYHIQYGVPEQGTQNASQTKGKDDDQQGTYHGDHL
ncbi:hypothetical protein ACFSQJ_03960 [Croceitalea marina]|uniref:Uncharacterized protein n=1 Tax=Croceitalea marina TaxID=1775166 RepID=A0ABW5MUC8_9FLAO